ncbi:MAG: two component, sigma54 specific, transcriptional regulator, Fis family [Labilithrix sp.]|nr:two component, sigma54 specific, transcriptional regulator, Fis family [Labilithrix sp.]
MKEPSGKELAPAPSSSRTRAAAPVQAAPLRVLAVGEDAAIMRALENVVVDEGDAFESARTIEEAVARASAASFDVAFVDLAAEGGAVLALCHHLPSLLPRIAVHALVTTASMERGTEALSLGAASVLVSPPTGDAIARALADARGAGEQAKQVDLLEEKLARERRRLETYDRLVRFARGAAQSDAVKAIVDGVAQLSGARGVALYASFGEDDTERLRLAAIGSALDLPASSQPADLARLVQARSARILPLVSAGAELGILVLDHAPPAPEPELAAVADLAAAMLSLVDRHDHADESVRVFPPRHFRGVVDRMLTLAGRHERRASVLAVTLPGDGRAQRREEATLEIADVVRNTDALCGSEDGDLLVFLPETTALGAHACRRRILARLMGDRRARPAKGGGGGPTSRGTPVAIGVATFPHDGANLKRLVRSARSRAADDARSPVHALGLDVLSLREVIDALIARPMLDAGPRSPFPLDIAGAALFTLVTRACREAQRGGTALVLATLQPGLGVAAAARQAGSPRVLDVRGEAGCENLEAIVVEAEHGTWVCCGRVIGERFRGIHCADPLLGDVLVRRIVAAGATDAG